MEKMKKYIDAGKQVRVQLMAEFGCSSVSVYNALHYTSYRGGSAQAEKIRQRALSLGGVRVVVCDEMETLHDSDGMIRQYFANGAVLELSKCDGTGVVVKDGVEVARYVGVTLAMIGGIQARAAAL